MTPEQAKFLLDAVYLPQIHNEHKATRRQIAAIPADQCGYKPHPDSMGALELAWHIASVECFFLDGVVKGKLEPAQAPAPETPQAVVAWYDENFAKCAAALASLDGEALAKTIDFRGVFNFPGVIYVGFASSHSIHHRGQLSAYLRPMGAKVPRIYGPSRDEPMPTSAAQASA